MSERPGPQPCNQIAGTFEEQLRRAKTPRPSKEDEERPRILDLIAEPLGQLTGAIVRKELEKWTSGINGR